MNPESATDYGLPVDRVKVGTHFRIKGLEFKVVFQLVMRIDRLAEPSRLACTNR